MFIISLILLRGNTNSNENIAEEFSLKESSLSSEFGTIEYTCTGNCYCLDSDRRFSAVVSRSFSVVVLALTSYSAFKKAQENFQEKCEVDLYDGCDHSQIRSEVDDCEEKDLRDEIMEVEEIEKKTMNREDLKDYVCNAVRNGFLDEFNVLEWCNEHFDEYFGKVEKNKIADELNCEEIVKEAIESIERHKEEFTYFADPKNFAYMKDCLSKCHFCGEEKDCLDGKNFDEEIDSICFDCMKKGSLEDFGAYSGNIFPGLRTGTKEEEEKVEREIEYCTPSLPTWQDVIWPVKGKKAYRFLKIASKADYIVDGNEETGLEIFKQSLEDEDESDRLWNLLPDHPIRNLDEGNYECSFYLFTLDGELLTISDCY